MNQETINFVAELKKRPDMLGIILFGSWARGNNRLDSDVDLVVILEEGFRRTVEYRNGQAFEIIYITEKSAFEFWDSHKDACAGLWEVAKVLYDKEGTIKRLENKVRTMLKAGKKPIDEYQLGQLRFDAEDQIKYAESILENDSTTANLILSNKVFALTELFFDIRQQWTPAPKQRLSKINGLNANLYSLLENFYGDQMKTNERIKIAKDMIPAIFDTAKTT